jgi:hypothetical protein
LTVDRVATFSSTASPTPIQAALLFIANALKQNHTGFGEVDGIYYFGQILLARFEER